MRISLLLGLLVLLFGQFGCSEHSNNVRVTVQISNKGQPVDGVSVTFVADDGSNSYAVGFTDMDGVAKMHTLKPNDGIKPGSYRIKLSKYEKTPLPSGSYDPAADVAQPEFQPALLVPKKFIDVETSGLTVVVEKKMPTLTIDIGEE